MPFPMRTTPATVSRMAVRMWLSAWSHALIACRVLAVASGATR